MSVIEAAFLEAAKKTDDQEKKSMVAAGAKLLDETARRRQERRSKIEERRRLDEAMARYRNMNNVFMSAASGLIHPYLVTQTTVGYGIEKAVVFASDPEAAIKSYIATRGGSNDFEEWAAEDIVMDKNGVLATAIYYE